MNDDLYTAAATGPDHYDPLWDEADGHHLSMEGVPITFREWAILWHDKESRIVKQEYVLHRKLKYGGFWISTVWLGINYQWGDGPPLIFETMAFGVQPARWNDVVLDVSDWGELDMARYSTKEQALLGHAAMVQKFRRKLGSYRQR
jgi:hypothetical protein